jgi:hypothetical protein
MTSASFVFLAALAFAALLALLARAWSHERARFRAMDAHARTGQDQPGWDPRYAWGTQPAAAAEVARTSQPARVTATVTGPQPPKWWQRPGPQEGRQGRAAAQPPSLVPTGLADEPQVPATHDRVLVDEQPATVTGVERVGRATRVHLRRDDGQVGFVDLPDVDAVVPVATSSSTASCVPAAPAPVRQPATASATKPAPSSASVTLGGITVSLGETAPAGRRPVQQAPSAAEQRRQHLAAHGYTGPTDADGYPLFDVPGLAKRAAG